MNTYQWNERIKALADKVRDKPLVKIKANKVAVIVEPRITEVLPDLLTWMMHLLSPYGWTFIVYCGSTNQFLLENFDVEIRPMNTDNLTIPDYNALFLSKEFWESMPFENILIFQTDSVLIDGNLDEFLHYDYVGAPWHLSMMPHIAGIVSSLFQRSMKFGLKRKHPDYFTGNGGLSLRRKSAMLRALSHIYNTHGLNEDRYYSLACKSLVAVSPPELAMRFSVETIFSDNAKGFHACWKYLSYEQMNSIYSRIDSIIKTN